MEEDIKKRFINEFGVHFKDSSGELEFALEFLSEVIAEIKKKISDYNFQTYSSKNVLMEGNTILSEVSKENGLIKLIDLKKALDSL